MRFPFFDIFIQLQLHLHDDWFFVIVHLNCFTQIDIRFLNKIIVCKDIYAQNRIKKLETLIMITWQFAQTPLYA